jgi:hypothetical protein
MLEFCASICFFEFVFNSVNNVMETDEYSTDSVDCFQCYSHFQNMNTGGP